MSDFIFIGDEFAIAVDDIAMVHAGGIYLKSQGLPVEITETAAILAELRKRQQQQSNRPLFAPFGNSVAKESDQDYVTQLSEGDWGLKKMQVEKEREAKNPFPPPGF